MRTRRQILRLWMTLAVVSGLALGLGIGAFGPTAAAQEVKAGGTGHAGVFTGTDDNGDFQAALDDAVARAEAAAGCCDVRIAYTVLTTTGERGGFAVVNAIHVKILAEW